jgi:hypothetical protein
MLPCMPVFCTFHVQDSLWTGGIRLFCINDGVTILTFSTTVFVSDITTYVYRAYNPVFIATSMTTVTCLFVTPRCWYVLIYFRHILQYQFHLLITACWADFHYEVINRHSLLLSCLIWYAGQDSLFLCIACWWRIIILKMFIRIVYSSEI